MATRIKVTDEMLSEAVAGSTSFMALLRNLGVKQAGGSHSHYSRRVKALGICTKHFTGQGHNKGRASPLKKSATSILIKRNTGGRAKSAQLSRSLISIGVQHVCSKCGQPPEWLGNPLTLDVDHINEDWLDDRQENLRFLCPNCHSQFSRGLIGDMA